MNLKARLARLGNINPINVESDPRVLQMRSHFDTLRERSARHVRQLAPVMELPGETTSHTLGTVHQIAQAYAHDHVHGSIPLAWCHAAQGQHLAQLALDTKLADVDVSRLLFLDTETTGLSGGAGTVAFLVGVAWFEQGELKLEQLLMRNYDNEPAMLERLQAHLHRASGLVTFNGKSFDWPLLLSRFILHRQSPPALPHLDALHCTRRVFGKRNVPLRLTHVERHFLGFERGDDIEGAFIPATYFAYLRGAPARTLTPIVQHNAFDLLTLVALVGALARRLELPETNVDGRDLLSLAELSVRAGQRQQALSFARAAADTQHDVAATALALSAKLLTREGDVSTAVTLLHDALERPGAAALERSHLHLALAKLYEHRLRHLEHALKHAASTQLAEGYQAHTRRLARIAAKLQRRVKSSQSRAAELS